ncbi:MAG: DUF655 domain-containing protein [Desulfurococcaceae archaeon]
MHHYKPFEREHRDRFHREHRRVDYYREPAMYVTDFIETGNPTDKHVEHRTQPVVQGVGVKFFSLLEATPLPAIKLSILERVDLDYQSKVRRILRISYEDLTSISRSNLQEAITRIIYENEKIFTEFFNIASPINIRFHVLELLPHVGKKTLMVIIDERGKKRFENLLDFKNRVGIDPVKILADRLIKELIGGEKYYVFIKPPEKEPQAIYLGYLEKLYAGLMM